LNNNLELLKKNGMTITTLPAAEIAKLREKMKPVIDKHSAALGTVVAEVQAELARDAQVITPCGAAREGRSWRLTPSSLERLV